VAAPGQTAVRLNGRAGTCAGPNLPLAARNGEAHGKEAHDKKAKTRKRHMSLVSSIRWAAVSQFGRIASQLVSVTVLSRIMPQQAYGVLAMAMTVTNLAFLFRDLGMSAVIIQRRELTEALKSAVHAVNVFTGFAAMGILLALSVPVAHAFRVDELALVIAALSLIFPISGFGLLSQALIERDSGFRLLARIEVASMASGLATSIALALNGAGVWSLVAQMLVATLVTNLQLRLAVRDRTRLSLAWREIAAVLKLGRNVSLFRFLLYVEQNADGMIIGRALGAVPLAIYAMSSKITLFPLQNITGPLSRALFPAFSRNQNSRPAMAATYLRSVGAICIVAAPIMATVCVLRADLALLLFGPKWNGIPAVLQWLAPVGFLQALTATTGVVFLSLDRSGLMLKLGIVGCALQLASYLVGVRWGIQGVAASFFVANLVNLVPCMACVMRCLGIGPGRLLDTVARPLLACAAMAAVLLAMEHLPYWPALPLLVAVLVKAACAALAYFLVLGTVLKQDLSGIYALVRPS
jgi:O-antigen/teichoic acid export membrane protein